MSTPYVVIGYHHFGHVSGKFAYCLARAVAYEGGKIKGCIEMQSPYTDEARNKIVERFLEAAEVNSVEYLMMADADIEFEADAVSRTIEVARNFDADVVWGNYSLGSFQNSLFMKDSESDLALAMDGLQPDTVYQNLYAGGTGWCLMRRKLLEEMREAYPAPWHWFEREVIKNEDGKLVKFGEDLSFGMRVHKLGKRQVGFTGVTLLHHKVHGTAPTFMREKLADKGLKVVAADGHIQGDHATGPSGSDKTV